MKLTKTESLLIICTVCICVICVLFVFWDSKNIKYGKGESDGPLPSYEYKDAPVNINTASYEQLLAVEGITEEIAASIIRYRGITPFVVREELMDIEGIDSQVFDFIKDKITLVK